MPPSKQLDASIISLVLLLSLTTGSSLCLSADKRSQQQEIEALKQSLSELQARVDKLEGQFAKGMPLNPAPTLQPVAGGWRKQANWDLLSKGMERHRVLEILGEPQDSKKVNKFEFWEYGDGKVSMYLRRLKSWKIPSGIDTD